MPHSLRLPLSGLSCASCVRRAETAVSDVTGVEAVAVNLANEVATVSLNDPSVLPQVLQSLDKAGYPAALETIPLQVDGMSCASCVGRIETAVLLQSGVVRAAANLATQTVRIDVVQGMATPRTLAEVVTAAGYAAHPVGDMDATAKPRDREDLARMTLVSAVLTLPVVVLAMGAHLIPGFHTLIMSTIGHTVDLSVQFLLTTLVLLWPGARFFRKGIPALVRRAPDMNTLVVLGTSAAWAYSTLALFAPSLFPQGAAVVYFEAAAVITTLILLGRWLEARAKGRTGAAIERLLGLQPKTARVLRDGAFADHPIEQIMVGDHIQIRAGERVPVDGLVLEGTAWIDESMITGEPLPVEKSVGAQVVAGTVNGNATLVFAANAVGQDTMLAQIVRMVENAQGAKLPIQALVDRVTGIFVPIVMGLAVLTVLVWLLLGPDPALSLALVAGVSVLIIACPCAMGLATPTSIMVGTGRAADMGVLFRKGEALQTLHDVRLIAFDKTGTLTLGQPDVIQCLPDGADDPLRYAAALEAQSDHPVARAVVRAAAHLAVEQTEVAQVRAEPGQGISGTVDGKPVHVGTAHYFETLGIPLGPFSNLGAEMESLGQTVSYVSVDRSIAMVFGVSDQIKPTSKAAIAALHDMGIETALVTGDNHGAARAVATEVGVKHVNAKTLPQDKAHIVAGFQERHGSVAFVGDGINDAPALAMADTGIAIGTGTDVAIEAADVVLMSGDLMGVVNAIRISRATFRNIRQNLFWAFAYNAALIPVAAGLLYPLWGVMLSPMLASAAMGLSSVFVLSNALRLRRLKLG